MLIHLVALVHNDLAAVSLVAANLSVHDFVFFRRCTGLVYRYLSVG